MLQREPSAFGAFRRRFGQAADLSQDDVAVRYSPSVPEQGRFLRSALVPLRLPRTRRYGLFHPGSGALVATDHLGFLAVNLLLDGASLDDLHERLIETGSLSQQGFKTLASTLTHLGALGDVSEMRSHRRTRAFICRGLGKVCALGFPMLPALPYAVTRQLLNWIPRLVQWLRMIARAHRYQWWLQEVLRKSGYDRVPPSARKVLVRDICHATSRTLMIRALLALATPRQAAVFIRRTVETRGMDGLQKAVAEGGAVVSCLHSEGFQVVLSIHARGFARPAFLALADMIRIRLDTNALPPDYLTLAYGTLISDADATAARKLLRNVVAGGIVTVPFDSVPIHATKGLVATLAGRTVRPSLAPAWLAVQSGRPLYLAHSHWDGERLVVEYSELLSAMDGMNKRERMQALTAQLYERAGCWIQAHPSKWINWTYLDSVAVGPS